MFYVFAEHIFGGILYPSREFSKELFVAASWGDALFFMIYGVLFSVVVLVWVTSYQKLVYHKLVFAKFGNLSDFVYRVFGREFYILDICSSASKKLINFSKTINYKMKY